MRIGIDIDETLVNTEDSFKRIVDKYNLNIKCKYRNIWTKDEFSILYPYFTEMLGNVNLKANAKEVIEKLTNLGHEIYIITARSNKHSPRIEDVTLDMLDKNSIDVKKVYFGEDKKSTLAKKLKLDLMIDDSEYVYKNMLKEGIDCILFGDKIKTWDEVLDYINRKESKDG